MDSSISHLLGEVGVYILLAEPEKGEARRLIWVSLALMGLLLAGLMLVTHIKRRLAQDDAPVSAGFTLSDLRQMHKSGRMTDEEFEKAKAMVVGAAKRAAERAEARKTGAGAGLAKEAAPVEPPPSVSE